MTERSDPLSITDNNNNIIIIIIIIMENPIRTRSEETKFFFVLFCDVRLVFWTNFDFPSTARRFVFIHVEDRIYCEEKRGQV